MKEEDLAEVEIWESVTDAKVYVNVKDPMKPGGWTKKKISRVTGPKRLQISVEERRYNQDLVPDERVSNDPFSNGMLVCVQGKEKPANAMTDEELLDILNLDDDDLFKETIEGIESEVVVRRLYGLSETKATHARYLIIQEIVDTRYRVGGSQRVVEEMIEAGEVAASYLAR
jgi:hypothetical protein